ncbi:MAG: ABC transporter substrate-binding protein [Deltaproteobacteria bacterium]|nr:ABC transporter substrate-binding protein [Deltaproteobacteria bacterium]
MEGNWTGSLCGILKSAIMLGAMLFALSAAVEAQQPKKVYRIGVLQRSTLPAAFLEAFKRGLRDHGYVEGQNIVIENRGTDGKSESSAVELVRLGVDVIVATGTGAVLDVKKSTRTIPIVMAPGADAVAGGLVQSLARPGGNVTGLTMITPDLTGKRLELLKEAVRGVSRLAAVYPLGTRSTALPPWLKETEAGAKALGLRFQTLGLEGDANTWDRAFKGIAQERGSALIVMENARLISERTRIGELAARHRLPAMFSVKEHVEAGGLLSYGPDLVDVHYRAATFVDKILKGTKPADLPVEQPTKFELVINLKTAKQIGLNVPPNLLARADKVIK